MEYLQKTAKHLSPLRYPGGKTKYSSFIMKYIELLLLDKPTLVEPYAGGAGASLKLLKNGYVSKIVINDLNPGVFAFWRTVLYSSSKLISKIRKTEISMREWEKQRDIYYSKTADEFSLGFATFFLNRTNRSGILTGGPIGGKSQTGNWKLDARYSKESLINRIAEIADLNDRIFVENNDGLDIVKKYFKRKNTLFFLDPPYYTKSHDLYMNVFSDEDHKNLISYLLSNEGNWILTYDNVPFITKLLPRSNRLHMSFTYFTSSPKVCKEVVYTSKRFTPKYYKNNLPDSLSLTI